MKKQSFTLLFRLASWLADRTGGWRPVVRWKLALGAAIIAMGVSSCVQWQVVKEPRTAPSDSLDSLLNCYLAAPLQGHSFSNAKDYDLCYDIGADYIRIVPNDYEPEKANSRTDTYIEYIGEFLQVTCYDIAPIATTNSDSLKHNNVSPVLPETEEIQNVPEDL